MSSYSITLRIGSAAANGGRQLVARHITTFARTCLQRDRRRSSVPHVLSLSVSAERRAWCQTKTTPGRLIALPALTRGGIVAGHVG